MAWIFLHIGEGKKARQCLNRWGCNRAPSTRLKTPDLFGGKFNIDTIYIVLYMSAIFIQNSAYNF
jgi:hypothetical protein